MSERVLNCITKVKGIVIFLLLLVMLVAGCARAPVTQSPAKPEAVINTFLQALSGGDVNTCLNLLADDVVFRQEPSGMKTEGKAQLEAGIRQLLTWHHQYSVIGPIQTDGDKVMLTIRETGDEYKILGLEYMTANLDVRVTDGKIKSWTATVNDEDWKKLTERTAGGIGIKADFVSQGMRVREVASNSPAYQAGIKPGDLIIAVNGVSYSQMREGEMQLRIQGPVGSRVKLTVTHEGAPAPVDVEMTRIRLEQLHW